MTLLPPPRNIAWAEEAIAVVWRLIFTDDHSMFVDYPNGGRPIEVDVVNGIRNVLLHIVFVATELPKTLSFVMHLEKHVQAALDLRIYSGTSISYLRLPFCLFDLKPNLHSRPQKSEAVRSEPTQRSQYHIRQLCPHSRCRHLDNPLEKQVLHPR
jgi:hypothetical protein